MEAIYVSIQKQYALVLPYLKIGLVSLLLTGIGYQLFFYNNLATIFNEFLSSFRERHTYYICLAVGLMPFNLAFETLKWLALIPKGSKMKFRLAYQAVVAGMALAIVTPNRLGEYGGRLLLVCAAQRWQAAVAMLLGSYCQLLVLFFGGLVGFCWFGYNYFEWQAYILWIVTLTGVSTCLLLGCGLLYVGRILPIIRKCVIEKTWRRWRRHLILLRAMSIVSKFKALQWAALRYFIYCMQYWLLLQFFGIKVPFIQGFAGIASIFLIQTGVPLSAGLALLARGEIALYVWRYFNANEISVLAATFTLFVINLVLPALLGTIFIMYKTVIKT